jgi:serine phosphatase RsbU (regulator of sigma subunit)
MVILGGATLAIFVRDLVHDRTEKQRLANELAAGRAVQQMLIPHATPAIAGFNIASVYLPYSEFGGDFSQVLSQPDGSVLVAIGDVSGKGMPAALLVSLLIGTLTALAETSSSPAILLSNLNRLILGPSQGGFTTCLILCAHPDGRIIVASAGHPAPHRQGVRPAG